MAILGSAAAIPTPTRFVSAILLVGLREVVLLDAGEGVQIRMQEVGVSPCKLRAILITHMHGDHFLGIFPLLQTMTMQSCKAITVVAPTDALCSALSDLQCVSECVVAKHGEAITTSDFTITPVSMIHGSIDVYGYHVSLIADPRGRRRVRVFYSGDGICGEKCLELLQSLGVDVVVHDSSFVGVDSNKARVSGHATAIDAAELAHRVNAKLLVLTHFSARYYVDLRSVLTDAYRLFRNAVIAQDLMVIPLALYAQA